MHAAAPDPNISLAHIPGPPLTFNPRARPRSDTMPRSTCRAPKAPTSPERHWVRRSSCRGRLVAFRACRMERGSGHGCDKGCDGTPQRRGLRRACVRLDGGVSAGTVSRCRSGEGLLGVWCTQLVRCARRHAIRRSLGLRERGTGSMIGCGDRGLSRVFPQWRGD
ncbi:hypothetical protein EJ06DRAFT_87291 [Trichodelitschia bisporula]|uniref:Uncharacterized protein n=1 Tax=Trichodelitschia bisporula TaxID=703511 RepID=A0A6G1HRI1_9PEZI|nr:hypothetical protein EJ06DRAFT_87291 [Trichodelitschia bisporula]